MKRMTRMMVVGFAGAGMLAAGASWADEVRPGVSIQVPQGPGITAVATRASGMPGEVFAIDVYLSNIEDLGGYQVKLVATGGTQGTLTMQDASIDRTRKDFVFGAEDIIDVTAKDTGVLLAAKNIPIVRGAFNIGKPRYAGTFYFASSPDAKGVFNLSVELGQAASMVTNTAGQSLNVAVGQPTTITVGPVTKRPTSNR